VTGASGGIGSVFAEHLARGGHDLVLAARSSERLEALAGRLREAYGCRVEVHAADLSREEDVRTVEERIAGDDALVLVVNTAGSGTWGPFAELDFDRELELIRLNVLATVRLTRAALPGMIARGRGAVINVASVSALLPQVYSATYCASKAFVLNFSEALHEELRETGVTVQALCPGFTRTGLLARAGVDAEKIPFYVWMDAESVVRSSLGALRRGRAVCIPGLRYRLTALLLPFVPRFLVRRYVAARFGRFEELRLGDDEM
jgi:short-subunit dehydrogenase